MAGGPRNFAPNDTKRGKSSRIFSNELLRSRPFIRSASDFLPDRAALYIGDLDALGFQLIPDTVGLGKILRFLRLVPLEDQGIDCRVALAGDGVLSAAGLGRLGGFLPDCRRFFL